MPPWRRGVHAVGIVEHLVEQVVDGAAGHHEPAPADELHGVARRGPVERRRHRCAPVDHDRIARARLPRAGGRRTTCRRPRHRGGRSSARADPRRGCGAGGGGGPARSPSRQRRRLTRRSPPRPRCGSAWPPAVRRRGRGRPAQRTAPDARTPATTPSNARTGPVPGRNGGRDIVETRAAPGQWPTANCDPGRKRGAGSPCDIHAWRIEVTRRSHGVPVLLVTSARGGPGSQEPGRRFWLWPDSAAPAMAGGDPGRNWVVSTVRPSREAAVDVHAEITANVWQVRVEVGQTVSVGEDLVILESMKMEIPVESPVAGTVAEIRVQPDTQVHEGDVVAVIDEVWSPHDHDRPRRPTGHRRSGRAAHARPARAPQRARPSHAERAANGHRRY